MASLELRNKTYRIVFMHGGRKYGFPLDTGDGPTATKPLKAEAGSRFVVTGDGGALRVSKE